jgi:hypothetical protein
MPLTRSNIYSEREIWNQLFDPDTNTIRFSNRAAEVFTLHASAAETVTGQSAGVEVEAYGEAQALLNVTAVAGTGPTLDVRFQTSDDGADWYDLGGSFAQQSAVNKPAVLKLTTIGRYLRAVWTIGGTGPSFTFTLKVVAKT